ncbi:MAG: phosphoenolpyruvate kinase, partial [Candidatus Marinimicrobia bacterium]|nr:phosphoenolpyruvate kinase [Candidatus Neomarinimicrobiota bacterium]
MTSSFTPEIIDEINNRLKTANDAFNVAHPGESPERQPVHTVYGGAHIFKADTANKMGAAAAKHLRTYAPNFIDFAKMLELKGHEFLPDSMDEISSNNDQQRNEATIFAHTVYHRVLEKLEREPVEDFRIDFEDGYGNRPDEEEDNHAMLAAKEVAKGLASNSLPPFIGIRIKPLTEEQKIRSIRTLDLFITTLLENTTGQLPENFVVTLPKVTIPEQVTALVHLFEALESKTSLSSGSLKMELMIETPQSILDSHGNSA